MVRAQTLHFRGSHSFFSLFPSALARGMGWTLSSDEVVGKSWVGTQVLSAHQAGLHAGRVADGSICLMNAPPCLGLTGNG
jgi:hypothetical protein